MGNREDLLEAAKKCLRDKGFSRTTARDIANASGVSLAGIGYHFRSKDALMNEALFEVMREWGDEMEAALAADISPDATPAERFEAAWDRIIASFDRLRPLWITQFELLSQLDHLPEVRKQLAQNILEARYGLAQLFEGIDPAAEPERARLVGTFYQAMLTGLVGQWLIDPATALKGAEVSAALRMLNL
ncbi:TetR/AcrR family transcriptional regulator [Nonomuraea sediminis]|uniref:TetR/AcrR family transcriptional regulator n=1 Tax=Nonomuraea sediminis TaxID=2835864 RepID=UPI001BDD694A|nr:TetR/AcrR family transcriptional regulator [Nonomuraea sediminis]